MKNTPLVLVAAAILLASCSQRAPVKPKIGIALHSFDDAASVAIRRSVETEALDKADLAIIDGQNQQSAQDLQVDAFFERKIGALAIAPVDISDLAPLIGKAKARATPIVFFDRRPSDEAMRSWDKLYFVGSREAEAGTAQGEMLAAYWKAEPTADRNRDGVAHFLALDGDSGGPPSSLLAEAFSKALAAAGIRSERLTFASKGRTALETAAAAIAAYGDGIEAVICADYASTLGTIAAFEAAGYFKPRRAMSIVGLGEGEPPPSISGAITSGKLVGTVYSDLGDQGKAVFDLAFALARGSDPSRVGWRITDAKYVWIPFKTFARALPAGGKR
jgi:methyl-galactoside transport system substrate-binding protein